MRQISQNYKSGIIEIAEVPVPKCHKDGVIVKTVYSLVSMGTESMKVESGKMNLVQKAQAKPEQVKQVIETVKQLGLTAAYRKVMNKLDSLTPLGYSLSGVVVEAGANVRSLKVGDRVAAGGGNYATHAEYNYIPENLCVRLEERTDMRYASMATVAAIGIQGLRQAELQFGESIAIVGMGLIGQLMLQIAKASGLRVMAIDINEDRVKLALEHGAVAGAVPGKDDIEAAAKSFTEGYGVDALFLASGTKSNEPIITASKIVRDRGRVVDIGITTMDVPWQPYYDKELRLIMSRSYGPGRYDPLYEEHSIDYPFSYVRFTEQRNMRTFTNMVKDSLLDLEYIITAEKPFDESAEFYNSIMQNKGAHLAVVFGYPQSGKIERVVEIKKNEAFKSVRIGLVGAGNFAKTMLLPDLFRMKDITPVAISTSTGLSSADTAKKFGFAKASTDSEEIFSDKDINLVMIATRHASHASLIVRGLQAGKFVYCEKPPALNAEELDAIKKAYSSSSGSLFVGYNRRFSSFIVKMKELFESSEGPKHLYYRINAGYLEKSSWYNDPDEGNRIIGECGHFVDTAMYLVGSRPKAVTGVSTGTSRKDVGTKENMNIIIEFEDGSVADILYFTFGEKSMPKEYIEMSSNMKSAVMDNFKSLALYTAGKKNSVNVGKKDKGHPKEMEILVKTVKGEAVNPFSMNDICLVSEITFKAIESSDKGIRIEL